MKLSISPDVTCRLERDGQVAELTASELAALGDYLVDDGRASQDTLPRPTLRRLFELGILAPEWLVGDRGAAYWVDALPHLALSPAVELEPRFAVGDVDIESIEPATALFLDPGFVGAAQALATRIESVLRHGSMSAAVRNVNVPRDRTLSVLRSVASDWLRDHPQLQQWVKRMPTPDGTFDFALRHDADASADSRTRAMMRLRVSGSSRSAKAELPLSSVPALAAVMDVVRGHVSASDVDLQTAVKDATVRRVLGAIDSVSGWIDRGEAPPVLDRATAGALTITHAGHAFLIVDGGGRRVLFDPVLFASDPRFETQPLTSSQLGSVDAIFLTHHHEDHMMSAALITLPHDAPIIVPRHSREPMTPRYADFLASMGFRNVRELAHGESYDAGEGLEVQALPFTGEARNRLRFGANTYRVARRGRSMLVHADASPDSDGCSLVSAGDLQRVVAAKGPIDVVFGTWWQERQFACLASPLALFQPGGMQGWLQSTEMCDCPPEFLVSLVKAAGARLFVTYAESGHECFLPRPRMSAYVPSVSLLWEPLSNIRHLVERESNARVRVAEPCMRFVLPEGAGPPVVDGSAVGLSRQVKTGSSRQVEAGS